MAGIYVHVPFCRQKCRYCDFASFPDKIGLAESYMACVYREMAMRGEELGGKTFDTLYIGGGTPSVVDPQYIAMLVAAAKKHFRLKDGAEITIEINPGTISASKIDLYKRVGINRFSVGLQTANDALLADLGRIHTLREFITCAKLLKGTNFSVDIMIGLKGQSFEDISQSIEVAALYGASHVSMYALTPEDGTPIYTDYLNGELPDGDEVAAQYDFGVRKLAELGYARYEVSNFCKKGRESRHNLNYWRRGEYIGFGVSASSHINNVRFTNTFDLDEYFKCIISNRFAVVDRQEITPPEQRDEFVMLAMRTAEGVDTAEFERLFGLSFAAEYASAIEKNADRLDICDGHVAIKPQYLFVQNHIIVDFLKN